MTGGLTKISLVYQVTLTIALAAFQLIAAIMEGRQVYYKHKESNFFPPWAYIISDILAFAPIPILDIFTFGTMVYFMSGMAYDAACYFTYCLTISTFTMFFGVFLRTLCYFLPNQDAATGCIIGLLLLILGITVNQLACSSVTEPVTEGGISWVGYMYTFMSVCTRSLCSGLLVLLQRPTCRHHRSADHGNPLEDLDRRIDSHLATVDQCEPSNENLPAI